MQVWAASRVGEGPQPRDFSFMPITIRGGVNFEVLGLGLEGSVLDSTSNNHIIATISIPVCLIFLNTILVIPI